jgi:carbon monoxide dehydrogenase subunit G
MEMEHSFTVPLPEERAWDVLLDVERVAPCMPGASLDSVDGDEIKGRIKVKVGPIAMTYAGTARFTERDPSAHVITLEASGRETRGAGTASATVRSMLEGADGQTHVIVHTSLNVTGRPAQFGRGVMAEVGGKLIGIFASNLADMLTAEQQPVQESADEEASAEPEGDVLRGLGEPGDAGDRALTIDVLNLPVRSYNSLRRAGIVTVGDLAARSGADLLAIENIGPASVEEISQKLASMGLTLTDSPASRNGVPESVSRAAEPRPTNTVPTSTGPAGTGPTRTGPASSAPGAGGGVSGGQDSAAHTAAQPAAGDTTGYAGSHARPSDDAIDLLGVAGLPVLKRAIPVAAALIAALLIALGIRIRRRRAAGS